LVADNIPIWTGAIQRKSGAGRGGGKRISLYGIERLRALILDLAVRGKLVPQEAEDEPASELLKRIKAEKSRFVASGKAKHGKPLAVPPEWPFEIPDTWSWSQLGQVTNYGQTEKADPGSVSPETWVLELEDIEKSTSRLIERVRYADKPFQSQKNAFQIGDVIYGKLRPYLDKVIVADEPGVCTTEMVPMRGYAGVRPDYIRLFLKTPFFIKMATDAAHGMNLPRLATDKAREAPFALPPLAEQGRIVAKVGALMKLCDALEQESAGAMAAHQALVDVLLATLVNSGDATDLARQWARLESNFDILFTTDASIDALKITILDLAVRGKLVEQDAADEAADKILVAAKKTFTTGGSKAKLHLPIKPADQPFRLPASWQWERFDNLIRPEVPIAYGVLVPGDDQADGIPFVRIADLSVTDPPVLPEKAISPEVDAQYERTRIKGGEILMGVVGSIGKLGVAPPSWAGANIARAICRIVPASFMDRAYVLWLLQSRFMQDSFKGDTRTLAQPTLNLTLIRLAATPIPPLAEQRRIVAKVDALMALCESLKARISDAAQTQRHLADAITDRAAA
jgi:type I restriction enzyme S subunit